MRVKKTNPVRRKKIATAKGKAKRAVKAAYSSTKGVGSGAQARTYKKKGKAIVSALQKRAAANKKKKR